MEILIVHWEEMEKLILEIHVTSHVMMVLVQLEVAVGHAQSMDPGVVLSLHVDKVCCCPYHE